MGVRVHVGDQEPICQAFRRFRKWVEYNRRFEKWHQRAKWAGVYVKPSDIRRKKKYMKLLRGRQIFNRLIRETYGI